MPKVEFAPLRVPLNRRLQTLAVAWFASDFLITGPFAFGLLIYLIFTRFYWVTCLYAIWWTYDRQTCNRGGRKWTPVRNWTMWTYYRDYFPIKLVKTVDIPADRNYIFTVHPHGIMCFGIFCNFATEANHFSKLFPGLRSILLTLEEQFTMPFHREVFSLTGACSATRPSMEWLLTKEGKGNALVLIPGGAVEALDAIPGKFDLTLAPRKGFCRMALKYGADLVPVLSFGENEVFSQIERTDDTFVKRMQKKITKAIRFSPPIFHGRGIFQYSFGMMPYRKPITTVVGKPIAVEKVDGEPSKEEITKLHDFYCETLQKMYDEHKDKYGFEKVPLKIK